MDATARVGVIGGTGFYEFLSDATETPIKTPYGAPSTPIVLGTVQGTPVAFLARHGKDHQFPAHRVPYRANLWALRALGVRRVIAPCAVGGLQPHLTAGTYVIPDQLVDRTSMRVQTYFDEGACHVSFADPYCPDLRARLLAGLSDLTPIDGGTMVVIEGPRFSTRAESQSYAAQGYAVINMTGHPEAVLARELAMCYATVALVTDQDAGIDSHSAVTAESVFEIFRRHTGQLKDSLRAVVQSLEDPSCRCDQVLRGMALPITLPG